MAPGAIQPETATNGSNGTTLKPTARAFHPTGTPDPAKYHSSSTSDAISAEAEFAAHNYHPLPIGMHPTQRIFQKLTCTSLRARKRYKCLGSRRQTLPGFPLSIFRRQPRPLPPRACKGVDRAGLAFDPQQSSILQRCLPSFRRVRDQAVWI
jgi:hypothetical protein